MSLIAKTYLALRRSPQLLSIPPYISGLCIVIGIAWLLLLPLDAYSRRTYISENALLPGQVHTYFSGSDQSIFNAYRYELENLVNGTTQDRVQKYKEILSSSRLKVAEQEYKFEASGEVKEGVNVYGVLQAPRGDATESVMLVGCLQTADGELNLSGVAVVLALARYFNRWSSWSKDVIFLLTPDPVAGPHAFLSAYHASPSAGQVWQEYAPLPLTAGAIQGAIIVEKPLDQKFKDIHVEYDGINGQLPNLDLINTLEHIVRGQDGMDTVIQNMRSSKDEYLDRLTTMLRGLGRQALSSGGGGTHAAFMPYHISAITISASGEGPQDDMAMGRIVESTFRSLNNLMEAFHQSFFFYIMMSPRRFVSIGTYLPSAMGIAAAFTIMALTTWILSGRAGNGDSEVEKKPLLEEKGEKEADTEVVELDGNVAVILPKELEVEERQMLKPAILVVAAHVFGLVPLFAFTSTPKPYLRLATYAFALANAVLPSILSILARNALQLNAQQRLLLKSLSLLLLGIFLSTLATLNFSLSLVIGLLASPLAFTGYELIPSSKASAAKPPSKAVSKLVKFELLQLFSPSIVFLLGCFLLQIDVADVLTEASFAWRMFGAWNVLVVWCVWWPAWLIGTMLADPFGV